MFSPVAEEIPRQGVSMKKTVLLPFAFLVALFVVCSAAFGHHGAAAYGDKVTVFKEATVTKFIWANPHTILLFDVKDDKGNVTHWAGEAGSPSAIGILGWTKNSVQPGDVLTVYIFTAKSGTSVGRLNKIVFADGKVLRDSQLGGDQPAQ
jgi:Family of unknown function (DUF6152)